MSLDIYGAADELRDKINMLIRRLLIDIETEQRWLLLRWTRPS